MGQPQTWVGTRFGGRTTWLRLPALVVGLTTSCGGEECIEMDCASLGGDPGKSVSHCRSDGECDGCSYHELLDENGERIFECQDAADAKCDEFVDRHAQDYCGAP